MLRRLAQGAGSVVGGDSPLNDGAESTDYRCRTRKDESRHMAEVIDLVRGHGVLGPTDASQQVTQVQALDAIRPGRGEGASGVCMSVQVADVTRCSSCVR